MGELKPCQHPSVFWSKVDEIFVCDDCGATVRSTPPASQNDDPLGDGSDYGVTGHWWGTASQSDEALVVEVASILDHPSLFMGGPSRQSTMKARAILPILQAREAAARADEREKALEEAAKYLDQFAPKLVESAAAIRALKGERT